MLRISNTTELSLVSQGYHFDDNGKKFVRIFTSLNVVRVQVKIPNHKELHIKSINTKFPYRFVGSFVEFEFAYQDIFVAKKEVAVKYLIEYAPFFGFNSALDAFFKHEVCYKPVTDYINDRLKEIWFV